MAGITISMVMFITTLLVTLIMILEWRLSAALVLPFALVYCVVDGAFVSANLHKVGWWMAAAIRIRQVMQVCPL
jgi:KUP system potassium uptake protein